MGDVSLMTLLAMGKTCPYMPTNFREFLRVASEMGPALTPLETSSSSSNLHSTAAQQQLQQSVNGQGDAPAGGVRPQLQLPPMVSEDAAGTAAAVAAAAGAVGGAGVTADNASSSSGGSGFWRSDVRSSAESRLQRVQSGRSSLDSRLLQQSGWSDLLSPTRHSEHYRQVHARDGINEMHPGVITNRLSLRDAASAGGDAAGSSSSDGSGSSKSKGLASTAEGEEGDSSSATASNTAANAATTGSSPTRTGKVKRRQFSLDLNIRAGSSSSGSGSSNDNSGRRTTQGGPQRRHVRGGANGSGGGSGSASTEELAHILSKSSLTDLVEMEDDSDSCNSNRTGRNSGSGHTTLSPSSASGSGFAGSPGSPSDTVSSGSGSGAAAAPSQILFTHEEIIVLKLIFSLFDRKGKDTITREDIVAYAEEGGDYAQLKEVDACMEAVDADGDGSINLHDYINFAARLKAISALQAMASAQEEEAAEQERLASWQEQANEDQQQ
jgi:hypothetical protein